MANAVDTTAATTGGHYQLAGSPAAGLTMGTWGFFVGFAAVALYGPAAKYFQEQMHLGGLALGLLVAAPQLTGSLLRIPFGAWVDRVGGRLPMLTLFGLSLVGMWGLVFILLTVKTLTVARLPDHHHVWLLERLRRRFVLGRHSASVLLVPAVAPGHGARAPMAASAIWRRASSHCCCPTPSPPGDWPAPISPGSRSFSSAPRLRMAGPRRLLLPARQQDSIRKSRAKIARAKGRSCSPTSVSGRRSLPPPRTRAPGAWSPCTSFPSAASWRSPLGFRPTGSISTIWT